MSWQLSLTYYEEPTPQHDDGVDVSEDRHFSNVEVAKSNINVLEEAVTEMYNNIVMELAKL